MITASGGFDCRKECIDFMHEHFPEQYRIANFSLQKRNKFKEATPALAGLPSCMGKPSGCCIDPSVCSVLKKRRYSYFIVHCFITICRYNPNRK
jgi:hypothetical protein